jgi:hypothetical protein
MGVTASLSGASFGAGFIGSQSAMTAISSSFTTSFLTGAAVGGATGFTSGFVTGSGNAWMGGESFGQGLWSGTKAGLWGGVSGAVIGGVAGGIDAAYGDPNRQRNFWTGDDIGRGRRPFSFNNSDLDWDAYRWKGGYSPRKHLESIVDGNETSSYLDYIRYGEDTGNPISNGAISKINNYTFPDDGIVEYTIDKFVGRADMYILDQAGYDAIIRLNGNIVTPINGYIPIWEGTKTISIQLMLKPSEFNNIISPFKFRILGDHLFWR